jgi:hypothetical protein
MRKRRALWTSALHHYNLFSWPAFPMPDDNQHDEGLARRTIVSFLHELKGTFWLWPQGKDLEKTINFHPDKDGTSLLTWLSTFAVGQGAALVVVLQSQKGRDNFNLVFGLYIFFSLVTIACIVRVLRLTLMVPLSVTRTAELGPTPQEGQETRAGRDIHGRPFTVEGPNEKVFAYDQRTVTFGRLLLGFMVLMFLLFVVLGYQGLLQGQTTRTEFQGAKFLLTSGANDPTTVEQFLRFPRSAYASDVAARLVSDAAGIVPLEPAAPSKLVILAVTPEGFEDNYESFLAAVTAEGAAGQIAIDRSIAYLWRIDSEHSAAKTPPFVLEQLFVIKSTAVQRLVEIRKPNKGDRVLLLLGVTRGDADKRLAATSYRVRLQRAKE